MEANELRIGNWVIDADDSNRVIQIKDGDDIDFAKDYNPVPLTEEWLVKFGFEISEEKIAYVKVIEISPQSWLEFMVDIDGVQAIMDLGQNSSVEGLFVKEFQMGGKSQYISVGGDRLKYVHQLQNLYFALTGEELQIKENERIE